ncbi:MAG: pilus assembly protein PilM, partial [Planctomycetes bacterium]|nr:pilus assembly protein PilM [Planctomycetota bacterium]
MALAFYIEYPRITVVEVGGNAKKPRIKRVIVGDLPEARNDDGTPVADKQVWFNTEIDKFCKENKLAGKAYLLVGPDGMRYRDMQIAFTERSKIDRVLQYEVEALIPSTPIEELALGYEILHTDENGSKLLVQAAEREYIKERITALEEAGMSVKAADSHLSGTLNLGLLHFDLAAGTPNTLWIDFAGTTATVSIVDDGQVLTSRVFMSPYLAGATGVTAQAADIKDTAHELAKEAKAHAEAFHDNESESLPGTDSVSGLPESESVNIGADEVANRIDHMSQDQLSKFISRVAIEARRTMYSHNYGEDPQRLVVSGLGYAGDALA